MSKPKLMNDEALKYLESKAPTLKNGDYIGALIGHICALKRRAEAAEAKNWQLTQALRACLTSLRRNGTLTDKFGELAIKLGTAALRESPQSAPEEKARYEDCYAENVKMGEAFDLLWCSAPFDCGPEDYNAMVNECINAMRQLKRLQPAPAENQRLRDALPLLLVEWQWETGKRITMRNGQQDVIIPASTIERLIDAAMREPPQPAPAEEKQAMKHGNSTGLREYNEAIIGGARAEENLDFPEPTIESLQSAVAVLRQRVRMLEARVDNPHRSVAEVEQMLKEQL